MKVVSDSSPLITLARLGCLDLLPKLYGKIHISGEVYKEVVVDGAALPGAAQVAQAYWIKVVPVKNMVALTAAFTKLALGAGEISAVFLAKEITADLVLIDDWRARRFAREEGLSVIGCVGMLEDLYEQGYLSDLRETYRQLIQTTIRIDLNTLQHSLAKFKLLPLEDDPSQAAPHKTL